MSFLDWVPKSMVYTVIYLCLLMNDLSIYVTPHIRVLTPYIGQYQ